MMKTTQLGTSFLLVAFVFCARDARACGESMFHSGQAMRYHAFISRQPADILFYLPATGESSESARRLYSGLEKAGHTVTLVTAHADLTNALSAKTYDVIIAPAADMDAVASEAGSTQRAPARVAIFDAGDGNQGVLRERYPQGVQVGDGLNQYLKSIEDVMQKRGT